MEWQFVIPRVNSELLSSDKNHYCVGRVLDSGELPDALKAARSAITGDPLAIFDHFDTFYSTIDNASQLSGTSLLRAYDLLYIAIDRLGTKLSDELVRSELDQADRLPALNAVKMIMYLMGGTVKAIDAHVNAAKDKVGGLLKKGAGAARKKDNDQVEVLDWDNKRNRCIVQLYNLFQLPLEKLWDPPVCEESFVDVICDICYRTLEQSYVKNRSIVDSVFQILGTAIKRYNHALSFPVRILQILEHCEASIAPIASGVMLLYEEFGISSIYPVLIKELIERLSVDAADGQTAKHMSQFLLELGMLAPKLIIPHLSTLSEELLNLESYVVRNCVLQIMGEAIVTELTSEELSDELKETRDDFLQDLFNHTNDISAHVRSKVLQIWHHIQGQNAVPLSWQHQMLERAVERLEDKSLLVRKNSIALIKAFLEHNPFSAKLSLAELRKQYETEDAQLQEIRNKMVEQDAALKKTEEDWEDLTVQMYPVLSEVLAAEATTPTVGEGGTEADIEKMVTEIGTIIEAQRYKELVQLALRVDFAVGNKETSKLLTVEQQCVYYMMFMKAYYIKNRHGPNLSEEFQKKENEVNFLKDSIRFAEIVSDAVPKLQDMLMSKSHSDVYEAIDFFTSAYLFGIKGTESGMQKMLYLVWSTDAEKRSSVASAYKRVLLEVDLEGRAKNVKVVQNLCQFMITLSAGHYTAMEVLIKEWVENGDLDAQMIQVMFEIFTKKLENVTESESRQALQLLVMVSAGKPSVVTANMALLESIGFGTRGRKDPRIFIAVLSLLMNSIGKQKEGVKYYKRLDVTSSTVEQVIEIFVMLFFRKTETDFDSVGNKTFDFIYRMVNTPDLVSQSVLITIYEKLHTLAASLADRCAEFSQLTQESQIVGGTQEVEPRQASQSQAQTGRPSVVTLPTFLISRFILIVGYVAMREMIYLDIDVYGNLKYRQELKDELKNLKKKSAAIDSNAQKRKSIMMNVSASSALKRHSGPGKDPQEQPEEEELLSGATAEDTVAEEITYICETEMLYSKDSLMRQFIPIIVEICKHPNRHKNELLQRSSVLTLIRLMSVSSSFCENNMEFLMNILKHTKNNQIKCNIIIGLSDLTFRFPNVIEPWTSLMYGTLHEKNVELRLTAVKMLSNLILHEMIRVKGQISDLAMCIVDPVQEIRTITEQFFKEIAHKSNILYNVLPDIISRLSDPALELEEEKYHTIMRHIIGLINKDKQIESLVEKLCLRFRVTVEQRQWRDIAFCLSLLSYNEKTIKKLSENIGCFKDKVQYDEIHASFKTIISNTSKLAKPELKAVVSEFEARIEECLAIREDGGANAGGGGAASDNEGGTAAAGPSSPPVARGKSNRGKPAATAGKGRKPPPASAAKGGRRGRPARVQSSSDEDSDSGEENLPPAASSRAAARARQNKKITKVIESDNSDDDEDVQPRPKKGRDRR